MTDQGSFADERRSLRVAVGGLAPAPMVGYVNQIVGNDPGGIDFNHFMGAYRYEDVDVVHFYDVDGFLGGVKKTPEERIAAASAIVEDVQKRGIALVRTVLGSRDQRDQALEMLDRVTSMFIVLDDVVTTPDPQRTTQIPQAHYRDRFLGYPRYEQIPGRLLCIARTGVGRTAEGPLKIFSVTDTPDLSLRVVGGADPTLSNLLSRAIARSRDTVSGRTESLSDAEMIREVDAAELVILPGAASLADIVLLFTVLSLDRPVLLPDSRAARALAAKVGAGWVFCYAGPITAEILDEKVAELRSIDRAPRPHLDGRDLDVTAAAYAAVYQAVAKQATPRPL